MTTVSARSLPHRRQPTRPARSLGSRVRAAVGLVRTRVPRVLLPALVEARFRRGWARAAVREDALAQMGFLVAESGRGFSPAGLDGLAQRYLRRQLWRGELRWHPRALVRQRVVGVEHLRSAVASGRGVMLNYVHHGQYEGIFPSLARHCPASYKLVAHPGMFEPDATPWLRQHVKVATYAGGVAVSAEVGSAALREMLAGGEVVAIASDVPGRTPVRFVGRELRGSFGAARLAAEVDSPVVVVVTERDARGPYLRVHPALEPTDFDSPQDLLDRMLALNEEAVLAWPEATDLPLTRWGGAEEPAETGLTRSA